MEAEQASMGYCLAERLKRRSPRCEWNFDSTSCDRGRNLTVQVSSRTELLAGTIPTHPDVFSCLSSESLGIVLQEL